MASYPNLNPPTNSAEEAKNRIIESSDFHERIQEWPELWTEIEATKERLRRSNEPSKEQVSLHLFQLYEAALAFYLRPKHADARRYKSVFSLLKQESGRLDLFTVWGVSIEDAIVDMCVSHNLDASALLETSGLYDDRFSRDLPVGAQTLNMQFCAALLRLADILDFDRERTPKILFESLGIAFSNHPGAEVSLREWSRHMAVHSLMLEPDELVVSAECKHPVIESAIRDYCRTVERELRDTSAVLKRNRPEVLARYGLDLPICVRARIRSVGYVFKDMSLRLNQRAVMSLLMGDRLYSSPLVAIRELLQNSLDACQARVLLEPDSGYVPEIVVTSERDNGGSFWLIVSDNGIGMDGHVLNDYFLEVGSSYYSSSEFERALRSSNSKKFSPISRFGIGIVSAFMLADSIIVQTRAAQSPRGDSVARQIVIQQVGSLAFVTEDVEREPGTTLRLRLKTADLPEFINLLDDISIFLRDRVVRPRFPVIVKLGDQVQRLVPDRFFDVHAEGKAYLNSLGIEPITIRLSRWSDSLTGLVTLLFFRTPSGALSHLNDKHSPLVVGEEGLLPARAFEGFEGNRLTVSGFKMILRSMNRIFGRSHYRIGAVIDVDVIGDDRVVYDVSREKIIGSGGLEIRNRIREAVSRGIQEMNLISVMHPVTQDLLARALKQEVAVDFFGKSKFVELRHVNDPLLLEVVLGILPEGAWPKHLHKSIAADLGISRNLTARIISTLISQGDIIPIVGQGGTVYRKIKPMGKPQP